jgi:HAD superfamily hydrolase (TIGR01509 family)
MAFKSQVLKNSALLDLSDIEQSLKNQRETSILNHAIRPGRAQQHPSTGAEPRTYIPLPPMPKPFWILFDCDGVLVDSETIAARTLSQFLTRLGWPLTPVEITAQFKGQSLRETQATVEAHLGSQLPKTWLYDLAMVTALDFSKELKPIPGVAEVLETLRSKGIPFCLASQSTPERIELSLRLTRLLPYFEPFAERCFSALQVPRGKPHPDLYLHASQVMGLSPETGIVIEDSPTGVQAGISAGMRVLGYAGPGGGKSEPLHQAGATVFTKMENLLAYLDTVT